MGEQTKELYMKTRIFCLLLGTLTLASLSYAEQPDSGSSQSSEYNTDDISSGNKTQTIEQVGTRKAIQYESGNVGAQLQQAKENVTIDKQNLAKAKAKKDDDKSQVKIDDASIDKYDAQLEEDEASVKQLEDRSSAETKKVD
jgi:hypothetical protein